MITGRFHLTDKTGIVIPAGPFFTRLKLLDEDGVRRDRWPLPVDDTSFGMEVSDTTFSSDKTKRPTRFVVKLVRYATLTATTGDETGRQQPAIVQAGDGFGTTTWGHVFHVPEFVNDDDGYFGWIAQHNAPVDIVWGSVVISAINETAKLIHRLGGYSMGSNGVLCPQ